MLVSPKGMKDRAHVLYKNTVDKNHQVEIAHISWHIRITKRYKRIKITATSNSICSTCPSLKSLLPQFAIPVLFYVLPSREHNWDFSWFSNCCRQFVMTSTVVSSPVQGGPSQQLVTWLSCGYVTLINSYLFTYRSVTVNKLGQQVRLFK